MIFFNYNFDLRAGGNIEYMEYKSNELCDLRQDISGHIYPLISCNPWKYMSVEVTLSSNTNYHYPIFHYFPKRKQKLIKKSIQKELSSIQIYEAAYCIFHNHFSTNWFITFHFSFNVLRSVLHSRTFIVFSQVPANIISFASWVHRNQNYSKMYLSFFFLFSALLEKLFFSFCVAESANWKDNYNWWNVRNDWNSDCCINMEKALWQGVSIWCLFGSSIAITYFSMRAHKDIKRSEEKKYASVEEKKKRSTLAKPHHQTLTWKTLK